MEHKHKFIYGDVPALGECACGAYKIWNRFTQAHEIHLSSQLKTGEK